MKYLERACDRIDQPQMRNAHACVHGHFCRAIDSRRSRRDDFADPVGRQLDGGCIRNLRHALAPPTREIGNQHVLAEMKLGLVENPPASWLRRPSWSAPERTAN